MVVVVAAQLHWAHGLARATPSRVAIVIGNNTGVADDVPLRYAESDARKIAKVLVDLGGFARKEVHTLIGGDSARLRLLMAETAREQRDLDAGDRPLVFLYYSGHGDGSYLHMAGTRMSIAEVRRSLRGLRGRVEIAVIDACNSGNFIRRKGATRGAPYAVSLVQDARAEGSIIITSSSADEVSQESDRIRGSFFTHYWVTGLYGAADGNDDGLVTLEEAYRYAHYRTVVETIESRAGVQHPNYELALSGEGNVVLSSLNRSTARLHILPTRAGDYFIVDRGNDLVLVELRERAGGAARMKLPPGRYTLRKREDTRLLTLEVNLSAGQTVSVRDGEMNEVRYDRAGEKGPSQRRLFGLDAHGPRAAVGLRTPLVAGSNLTQELRLGYELRSRWLFVRPQLGLRRAETGARSLTSSEVALGLFAGALLSAHSARFRAGLEGGGVVLRYEVEPAVQAFARGLVPMSLEGGAVTEVAYPLAGSLSVAASFRAGFVAFELNGEPTARMVYGFALGLGWDFRLR